MALTPDSDSARENNMEEEREQKDEEQPIT